jgi:ATP-binding cassette subfamily B protein
MINQTMTVINRCFGDASEMTQNLDEPRLVDDAPDAVDLDVTDGQICFYNLRFQYTDGVGEDGEIDPEKAGSVENIFEDFSMTIPAGQRIGLVGRSGSS